MTYVTRVVSQTFAAGVTEMAISLAVAQGAYLAPDATFTINITSATLTSSTGWWISRYGYGGASLGLHKLHHFNELFLSPSQRTYTHHTPSPSRDRGLGRYLPNAGLHPGRGDRTSVQSSGWV